MMFYVKVNFQDQLSQLQSQKLAKSFRNLVSMTFGLERNTHLLNSKGEGFSLKVDEQSKIFTCSHTVG